MVSVIGQASEKVPELIIALKNICKGHLPGSVCVAAVERPEHRGAYRAAPLSDACCWEAQLVEGSR